MGILTALLVLAIGVVLWIEHLGAREAARAYCLAQCRRARVQLLDQTVALRRWRIRWVTGSGVRLRRQFAFDFSSDGLGRRQGYLWLIGRELELISMDSERGEDFIDP